MAFWEKPNNPLNKYKNVNLNNVIPSGIYVIDKYYCKKHIKLCSNNKTNTLIDNKNLYLMLHNCMKKNMYIKLPEIKKKYKFNILTAFK